MSDNPSVDPAVPSTSKSLSRQVGQSQVVSPAGTELEGPTPSGVLLVTTLSGSRYRLDFEARTATRFPDPDDAEATLRRDREERPLLALLEPVIGRPLILVLDIRGDGIPTRRETNLVTAIERIK